MARKHPNRADRQPKVARQVIGVATAGVLAALAVVASSNKGRDTDSEAALQHALRPTMTRTAGKIIEFAGDHPSLSHTRVGKRVVEVTVDADVTPGGSETEGGRPDKATLDVITRRQGGGTEPDPGAPLSVSINRSGHVNGDPDQEYEQVIAMQAPVDGGLGWAAWEQLVVADTGHQGPPQLHIDTTRADDPAAAARAVAQDTSGILEQTEFDLNQAR